MEDLTDRERQVQEMYDCDESPLFYKIKPKGTIKFVESDKITKDDFDED